ncbi:MAG TPA: DUF3124 domain-containing protein [Bacteroidales bacterium]|nr:DUF3124 domain-containing protein [Bacteroidales bacterium]HOE04210.1 DUF3124 domain-containing protein [Bacteroidales bacterium]HQL70407.1 DUF3124 domain-containing protein [Bacteroidales bacterium]
MRFQYKYLFSALALCEILVACGPTENSEKHFPSANYHYTDIDTSNMMVFGRVYVPAYSDIYQTDGTRRFSLTATLSIRNVGFTDTVYIYSIDYYDSHGKLLRKYAEKTLMLLPLESLEFVVEGKENKGGAGANFIVEWTAARQVHNPLIQTVMIGTEERQGISFCTDGVLTDYYEKPTIEF